jgi:hypothetical protein
LGISNVMAHERTARIFALRLGRFTIAFRPDFGRGDGGFASGLHAETADGEMDLRSLGPEWALLFADSQEEAAGAFLRAYELAGADRG